MSLSTTSSKASFNGNGTTGPFTFGFKFFSNSDIDVTKTSLTGVVTVLAEGSGYTLTGAGSDAGGSVTLTNGLQVGETLLIDRIVSLTQDTVLPDNGAFFASTHEKTFDKLVMMIQQIFDMAKRAIKMPLSYTSDFSIPDSWVSAQNMILGFDNTSNLGLFPYNPLFTSNAQNPPWVDARSYATLAAAVAAIGSTKTTLMVCSAWPVTANLSIPSTLRLAIEEGGLITVSSGMTLTVNGPFYAGPYQVFAGAGTVALAGTMNTFQLPVWGSNVAASSSYYKNVGEAQSGLLDWCHNGDAAFLMHMYTGPNYAGGSYGGHAMGSPALIGLGVGDGGAPYGVGLHTNVKNNGTCIEVLTQPYATNGCLGFHGLSNASYGPFMLLEGNGNAPILSMTDNGGAPSSKYFIQIQSVTSGQASLGYVIFDINANTGITTSRGGLDVKGGKPLRVFAANVDTGYPVSANRMIIDDLDIKNYAFSSGSTDFPWKISFGEGDGTEMRIATGSSAAIGSETLDAVIIRAQKNSGSAKIGFLGAAPAARPIVTGSKGGNAALASLVTALASLGLITDATT